MITVVLIFLLLISTLTCFAVFRRRLFLYPKNETESLPPAAPPKAVSLFAPTEEEIEAFEKAELERVLAERRAEIRRNLLARMKEDDFIVLNEAKEYGDFVLYEELLDLLTEKIKLEPEKSGKVALFVSENNLTASRDLAETVLTDWKENPSSKSLPKVLHVSALANSAESYLKAVEASFDFWQQGGLENISGNKLIALLESHYQLLKADTRASGAGFLLKEKLASVREEVLGKQ